MSISLKNKNFAVSKLLSGIASGATQLTVLAGEGSKFPTTGTFRAVIWSQSYESPIQDGTREIVTMQLSAGDVFTISRAQESTSAKAWNANDNVAHVITAGKVEELETEINAKKTDTFSATDKLWVRASAGPGPSEETPCTAAARSILDDATVAAILTTLGGMGYSDTRFKIGAFTRAMDAASGDVAYTGIGFQPKAIIFLAFLEGKSQSVGFDNINAKAYLLFFTTVWTGSNAYSICQNEGSGNVQAAAVKTFDADGFTLTWTKIGSPASANANIYYLAFR